MIPDISLILPAYNEARVIPVTTGEPVLYFENPIDNRSHLTAR